VRIRMREPAIRSEVSGLNFPERGGRETSSSLEGGAHENALQFKGLQSTTSNITIWPSSRCDHSLGHALRFAGELSPGYLDRVRAVGAQVSVYQSILYKPEPGYVPALDQALVATESAAWRGRGVSQGLAQADNLSDYLRSAERRVRIITSAQVPMGGSSGLVPVSIQNGLLLQAVQVKVVATVAATSQLTIGHFQDVVTIPPQQAVTVRLPVSSAPQGSTEIRLSLTSSNGMPLTFVTGRSLTVASTRYGRAILFLIAAAIGVLVLTSVYRGIRRWLNGDTHLVNEEADPPGSVVTGTSDALHPTEAPDDLADARRWVDDA